MENAGDLEKDVGDGWVETMNPVSGEQKDNFMVLEDEEEKKASEQPKSKVMVLEDSSDDDVGFTEAAKAKQTDQA